MRWIADMRHLSVILIALALAGCEVNMPVDPFDPRIAAICKAGDGVRYYSSGDIFIKFTLHTTDDVDQIYEWCGPGARACMRGSDIYVPVVPGCQNSLAHELSHIINETDVIDSQG